MIKASLFPKTFLPKQAAGFCATKYKALLFKPKTKIFYTAPFKHYHSVFAALNIVDQVETSQVNGLSTKHNASPLSNKQEQTINLIDYESWDAKQVESVLTSPKAVHGAGLSDKAFKPLYDAGFDGTFLANIAKDIKEEGRRYALDQLKTALKDSSFKLSFQLSITCETVVNWVDALVRKEMTTLSPGDVPTSTITTTLELAKLEEWTREQVCTLLRVPKGQHGASLAVEAIMPLYDAKFDGTSIANIAKDIKKKDEDYALDRLETFLKGSGLQMSFQLSNTCKTVVRWVDNLFKTSDRLEIKYNIDAMNYYLITGKYDISSFPSILENLLQSFDLKMMEREKYESMVNEEIKKTKQALGKFGNASADWPYVFSGSHNIRLDWRFSADILASECEQSSISEVKGPTMDSTQQNTSSVHEFVANSITENKILILLALSGAGKSHTIFNLSASNTAFCMPIDFGSVEDLSNTMVSGVSAAYREIFVLSEQLKCNPNNDPTKATANDKICKKITSILATCFTVRAMILLKLLKSTRKSISPSQWIKYLYHEGGEKVKALFERVNPILQGMNDEGQFMTFVLGELKKELATNSFVTCKKIVLTVDEINPIIVLGYGKISTSNLELNNQGSVATLLIRLLERVIQIAPSVLAGTKINNALLQTIASSRPKEHIIKITFFGPPTTKQMTSFASKFIYAPKEHKVTSGYLFESICSLLKGRRRVFMNFLKDIVKFAHENPYPEQLKDQSMDEYYKIVDEWKVKLIVRAFGNFQCSKDNFKGDVHNFLENSKLDSVPAPSKWEKSIYEIKKELTLYLLFKNGFDTKDIQNTLNRYEIFSSTDKEVLKAHIESSAIYFGIGFGKILPTTSAFIPTEVINMIILNEQVSFMEAKLFIDKWLSETLSSTGPNRNSEIGKIFEVIGALILQRLGYVLNGNPLTSSDLFSKYRGTILDDYTIPKRLSIIHNRDYWKFLSIFQIVNDLNLSNDFRDVCVVGLNEGIKVDVKSVAVHLQSHQFIEVNMSSKFITSPEHEEEFKNNFHATNSWNGFLQNDLMTVQKGQDDLRNDLLNLLESKPHPYIRIIFDYTASVSHFKMFEELVNNEKKKTPEDIIVLFGKHNPAFEAFFKEHFIEFHTTIAKYMESKVQQ